MIIAARTRAITYNWFGIPKSYMHWPIVRKNKEIPDDFVITHGGGALFKKNFISEALLNDESYLTICPKTDDLWFSMLAMKSSKHVYVCADALIDIFFISHEEGLANQNTLTQARGLLAKIYNKLVLNILGRLGVKICGNDDAYKKIQAYSKSIN
ncbi:hypothetical protein D3C71_1682370 [compost metagenome]